MPAFLLADVQPDDVAGYRESGYLEAAVASAGRHGGRYRARGGRTVVLEGDWEPRRMAVIEFPTMGALMAWYHDPEYQEWIDVRRRLAPSSRLVALEGIAEG